MNDLCAIIFVHYNYESNTGHTNYGVRNFNACSVCILCFELLG